MIPGARQRSGAAAGRPPTNSPSRVVSTPSARGSFDVSEAFGTVVEAARASKRRNGRRSGNRVGGGFGVRGEAAPPRERRVPRAPRECRVVRHPRLRVAPWASHLAVVIDDVAPRARLARHVATRRERDGRDDRPRGAARTAHAASGTIVRSPRRCFRSMRRFGRPRARAPSPSSTTSPDSGYCCIRHVSGRRGRPGRSPSVRRRRVSREAKTGPHGGVRATFAAPSERRVRGSIASRGRVRTPGVLFSGRADGSAPARRSARTIHARPSHAAYARRVGGPSRPTSSDRVPRVSSSLDVQEVVQGELRGRTRPNSLGELFSTHAEEARSPRASWDDAPRRPDEELRATAEFAPQAFARRHRDPGEEPEGAGVSKRPRDDAIVSAEEVASTSARDGDVRGPPPRSRPARGAGAGPTRRGVKRLPSEGPTRENTKKIECARAPSRAHLSHAYNRADSSRRREPRASLVAALPRT